MVIAIANQKGGVGKTTSPTVRQAAARRWTPGTSRPGSTSGAPTGARWWRSATRSPTAKDR
jgi:hypothetical protein